MYYYISKQMVGEVHFPSTENPLIIIYNSSNSLYTRDTLTEVSAPQSLQTVLIVLFI